MNPRYRPLAATTLIFIVAYTLCVISYPGMFSTRVLGNFLTDNAFLGIAAVGATFVILSGGIDLSVGAVIGLTGVITALLISHVGLDPIVVFPLVLVLSACFGAVMGAVIHFLKVPPFIVTLAGMFLARGIASVLTQDSIPIDHPIYRAISQAYFRLPGGGRLSAIGLLMLAAFLVCGLIAHRTRFGSYVYAIGGNPVSAALMGVPTGPVTIGIYALSAFLSGLAGIVYSLYTSAGYPLAAVGIELDAIAAVVIGGTLLTGGYGFIFGTLIGVMLQGLVQTYIVFEGTLSSWWTKIAIGALLFMFILLQKLVFHAGSGRTRTKKASA
ncbi:galactofuranose ABC transporter, permease protein YjfF [Agrobacterium vitis]|uniref:ABC transporter membrane spanning protein (Ribose) n=2 Tax=Rhizobium/Agrobacterium group TaxID=227290 RepID=B9K045_ALLAM|nr:MULTISPECIES: galactofuranose ABC transporter, permease protein YjfF [Rhizobium/Agrobacterium group]ACM38243.1 ABC transporter membrane spanning protein (ribose) [Allorhizobium ampelinum S4]MCF1445402.1 sugar ABC transporter permease YjfF [Allorhizobium ampelinum]MCF1495404.1 sugar ABC transporter permease YjfF [Allorhizobium ampelinum]MUO27065.1 sugar ABC transporter permease YjfF [Agrobacterium vitis]MUO40483.1 sugar ABC transporter permease YjfF [Agrobacterium vitis]